MTDNDRPGAEASSANALASYKVSRWDRPPDPHDWRWVVGYMGRALITVGLMMFAFVGYQLWGTGIQEARSQDQLGKDFKSAIADASATSTTATVNPNATVPVTGQPPPPDQPFPHQISEGEAVAAVRIPRIDLSKYVVAGVGVHDLRKGVGHFPNTPFPGQLGNAAIAGHRTTYGQPFYSLDKLKPGDDIEVSTILGGTYVYVVSGSEEVGKDDYHVITDSDPKKATLTLITCTPIGTASRRLVIHAELDQARSSPVGKAALYYGQTPGATGDTGANGLPDDVTSTSSTPSATTVVASSSSVPATATTIPTATTTPTTAGGFAAPSDAFNQGWFSDSNAFVPVILWGLLLLAVWRGSYLLAKRYRRLWLAFAVGFVPFVVVSYFFFENVNRLLPAAI